MGVRLNRCLGPEPATGEYTVATESGRPLISCPLCSQRFELRPGIEYATGLTSHAVKCPNTICPFWEPLELESLNEDVLS